MTIASDMAGAALIILGVDIIISVFLLALTLRVRKVKPKKARLLFAIFGIFLVESVFVSMGYLGLSILQNYSELSVSIEMLTVMLIFYVGMVRVNRIESE
jgi:hypothetical protein